MSYKLKHREIKDYRERLLLEQDNKCALCKQLLEKDEAVLDHDHKNGYVRKVLHRGCNLLLGKIENNLARNKITPVKLKEILNNLEDYITDYQDVLHPTHKVKGIKNEKKKRNVRTKL